MTDGEIENFVSAAVSALEQKQDLLQTEHGFGSFARWFFDQRTEKLEMFDAAGQKVLVADVVDVGSFATNSNTWKWAWSNDSITPPLREKAESLKALADVTGIDLFVCAEAFPLDDEQMAWELVAMCVRHLGAIGVYRAPSSTRPLSSFLAITRITHLNTH